MADYGATVLRVDRTHPMAYTSSPPPATADQLTRRKASIAVDTKSEDGLALIKKLVPQVDVLIDPFRPGVLERMGLEPDGVLLKLNKRLIVARMTGFRRDGKYKDIAGHDINYIAVSGVLSMLGRKGEKPYAPGNILGDFAGGGAVCFMGILLALLQREKHGLGQVVEANMVDGSAYMGTMPRFATKGPVWDDERGSNVLDGGCPYYDTYETEDGKYMSVGALEPQFFAAFLRGMEIDPQSINGLREDKQTWPTQREMYAKRFKEKTRAVWESIFDGTNACCTPVLTHAELEKGGFDQRPMATLRSSPGFAIAPGEADNRSPAQGQGVGVQGGGWSAPGLYPGEDGEKLLAQWMGWERGQQYIIKNGGLAFVN